MTLFRSFFIAGFETATMRRFSGERIDCVQTSGHDSLLLQDYQRLESLGIQTARDGVRWYMVDAGGGTLDLESVRSLVQVSRETGVEVIWDLCHFGWPDDLDVFSGAFVERFGRFAHACAQVWRDEGIDAPPFIAVNEISYLAWAAGEIGIMFPGAQRRGAELKRQLVRAAIVATTAIREVCPNARSMSVEPLIHVAPAENVPGDVEIALRMNQAQFEACEMLMGRQQPELGGDEAFIDVVGVNYYPQSQWLQPGNGGAALWRSSESLVPLHQLIEQAYLRYRRPLILSETGAEDGYRAQWLRNVAREVHKARHRGVPVEGVCWYPILDHPFWTDGRPCQHGMWSLVDQNGHRTPHRPLLEALQHLQWVSADPVIQEEKGDDQYSVKR